MITIAPDLATRVLRNYRLAALLLGVATVLALTAAGFEAASGNLFASSAAYLFSPLYTLAANAVAWIGVIYWLVQSQRLTQPGPQQYAIATYNRIWGLQSAAGPIAVTGAIVMIPGSLLALQMGISGLASVFPLFAGAILHFRASRINKDIRADQAGTARPYYPPVVDALASAPSADDIVVDSSPAAVSSEVSDDRLPAQPAAAKPPVAPGVLFIVSLSLIGVYVIDEFTMLTGIRAGQSIAGSSTGVSMQIGLSQFIDMFLWTPAGIVIVVLAAINLGRGAPRKQGIATIVCAGLGLALIPGQLSTALGATLGASSIDESNLLEPQSALSSISSFRAANPVSPAVKYLDNSYVVDSLLHDFHYDMEVPMFADESGAVHWLQFGYPQGVICVYIGTDVRSGIEPSDMTQVGSLNEMSYFGDFAATECTGTQTVFYRF